MQDNTSKSRLNGIRFLRQFFFFLFFLVYMDILVITYVPPLDDSLFDNNYRLPSGQELVMLPFYLEHIKAVSKNIHESKTIAFIGASPTYGIKIKKSENTYPYAYKKAFNKISPSNSRNLVVYNISANGFLLSDQYYILKKIIFDADIFFIQLNYHTFNPATLNSTKIRYPELPEKLQVSVSSDEAKLLDKRPTPFLATNFYIQNILKKYWAFYREKDRLASTIFNENPELYFYHLYEKYFLKAKAGEQLDKIFTPFIELTPAQQMIIVKRYNKISHFKINDSNSEISFLNKILELLKNNKKKAAFFLAPVNVGAINDFELIDWNEYKQNVSVISEHIKKDSFLFLDYNRTQPLPEEYFFDISHTLDNGGEYFGDILFKDTKDYVLSFTP